MISVVRLGTPRLPGEGLRLGTVRFLPRGVRRADLARLDWFDVWYPNLAPSAETLREFRGDAPTASWPRFSRRYRREMDLTANRRTLDLFAALSLHTDFAIGCYCADPAHCHRTLLRELLAARGARFREV